MSAYEGEHMIFSLLANLSESLPFEAWVVGFSQVRGEVNLGAQQVRGRIRSISICLKFKVFLVPQNYAWKQERRGKP
jgi:hypothetical protein